MPIRLNRLTFACILPALLSLSPAAAHDEWGDGVPVPSWVKSTCCGVTDVHHLKPEQVHYMDNSMITFDGYKGQISQSAVLPSPDGTAWVFWRTYPDGSNSVVYCAFLPPQSF